ncbi:PREDICTED: uncharacterized protein LOC105967876 [Erythranthe guttata]|uniref:uncharacterized protein LOC105967876 n=1 Tax=Erythranthe guttata TaxID=4155 RepID=UPI00064D914E|nr:PREDICTED: uncharacterized protein LOC105967876 [Erythranthe guttata]|eukprot:XP_012847925.1 PREDICTED: uncharacterized protein LOC105967876 [Erythranthe guttata]
MVLSKTAKAHDLWKALASLFTDNEDYRAIQLEEQFKSLKKGSLSIHDYCQLLKTTADNLADVGNPVSDKQLVLQTLHGLLDDINEAVILDDRDYYYGDEEEKRGWIKYLSFGYSNSGMWILVQLSWRFLLSLIIALFVFYIAAKPPPPNIFIKIGGIGGFRLAEGVDGSGASTKILSCNCSIDLIIENKSKLFGLHINPPFIQLLFGHLPFAVS